MKYFEDEEISLSDFDGISECVGAEFISCIFEGLNLTDFNFKNTKFIECRFIKCNLSNIQIDGATFRDLSVTNSKLVGINFSNCNSLFQISFEECLLDYSLFQQVESSGASFEKCSLKDVVLSESDFSNSNFSGCNLRGANFNNSNLSGADFRGATEYDIDPLFSKVKKAKFSLPEALTLLSALEITVE